MVGTTRKIILVIAVCLALVLNGWGRHSDPEPLTAIVNPAIPLTVQEVSNPLRGQYEELDMCSPYAIRTLETIYNPQSKLANVQ